MTLPPAPRTTSSPEQRGPRQRVVLGAVIGMLALVPALSALRAGPPATAATSYAVTRTIVAGANPNDVALDLGNGRQFVQNAIPAGSGTAAVSVVSNAAGAVTATYPTAQFPVGLAYEPGTDRLYVAERRNGTDVTATATSLPGNLFPAEEHDFSGGRIEVFDATTGELQRTFDLFGYLPTSMAKDPTRNQVLVGQTPDMWYSGSPGVLVVDFDDNEVIRSYTTPGPPTAVAIDPSTGRIYVTATNPLSTTLLPLAGTFTVIDPRTNPTTVTNLAVGADPGDVVLDVAARRAYVVNRGAGGSVSAVNLDTNQVLQTVNVAGARQVAVDPGNDVYVTRYGPNRVSVLRAGDLAAQADLPVAGSPDGVAVDPVGRRAHVTTFTSGRLVTITRQTTPDVTTTTLARPATTFPPPVTTAPTPTGVTTTRPLATTTTAAAAPVPTVAVTTTVAPASPGEPSQTATTLARSQQAAARFVAAVPSPLETRTELAELAQDAFLAILFLALLSLPINVVNGIAETNAELLAAKTAGIGQRFRPGGIANVIANLPLGLVLVAAALVSAVLYGFLEPTFGFDEPSLALVLGVTLAVLILNALQRLTQIAYLERAYNASAFLRLLPGFAVVALGCVAVSRIIGLQPGLLLGPLATVGLRDQLPQEEQGKALAVSYAGVALLGVAAWFSRATLLNLFEPGTLTAEVVGVAWTTLVIACTETIAFNMIPLRFLDGHQVIQWSKGAWAALAVFGVYGFVHVLINPASGAGEFSGRTLYLGILLVIYLLLAGAFWAYFHFRTTDAEEPPAAPPPPREPAPQPQVAVQPPTGEDPSQSAWRAIQGSGWPPPGG